MHNDYNQVERSVVVITLSPPIPHTVPCGNYSQGTLQNLKGRP